METMNEPFDPARFQASLRLTATAGTLAQAIYYGRAEAFGIACQAWEALPKHTRHFYIGHARDVLEAVRPLNGQNSHLFEFAAGLARAEASKVVGAITPMEPDGLYPLDGRD